MIEQRQYLFKIQQMSRVISNAPIAKTSLQQKNQPRESNYQVFCALKIVAAFIRIKQLQAIKWSLNKISENCKNSKKKQRIVGMLLNSLFSRKTKSNCSMGFKSLLNNYEKSIKIQFDQLEARKKLVKQKSSTLISLVYRRLERKKLKETFQFLNKTTKLATKLSNYRIRHLTRVFQSLRVAKQRMAYSKLKLNYAFNKKLKIAVQRVKTIFDAKRFNNILSSFCKIRFTIKKGDESPKKQDIQKKTSRVKAVEQIPRQPKISTQENKIKDLEQSNLRIQEQLNIAKQKGQQELQGYRNEIAKLQGQHESLKFNSGILDEAIQDLEGQIIQRQKKSRKGMPISQLWERVYHNFLLLLAQYSGKTIEKQKVLQYLESPLAPLNIDVQSMKAENVVLSELLLEYKKFFNESQTGAANQQLQLPYDILMAKNKFLYTSIEALIRQGLGTESEIKQLEIDLQSVVKQN